MNFKDPPTAEETAFAAKLGEIVIRWNDLEEIARHLLYSLMPRGKVRDCVVGTMSTGSIIASMRAISESSEERLLEHVMHFCSAFSKAQEFRNLFVHAPRLLAYQKEELQGLMQASKVAKGRLTMKSGRIKQQDLNEFCDHLIEIRTYFDVIFEQTVPDEIVPNKRSLDEFMPRPFSLDLDVKATPFSELE